MASSIFNKDYTNKQITVTCSYKTPLSIIWDAFSNPEIVEKWMAPKPFKLVSHKADFKEGGCWLYYMQSPEGEKHWGITHYKNIEIYKSYEALDAFCDEDGTVKTDLPVLNWKYAFSEKEGTTTVYVTIALTSKEEMKQLLEMGFEEGYQTSLNQLQELLKL